MGLFNRKPKEEPIVEEQGQESSDQVGQETPAGANLPDDVQQLFAATENIKQEKEVEADAYTNEPTEEAQSPQTESTVSAEAAEAPSAPGDFPKAEEAEEDAKKPKKKKDRDGLSQEEKEELLRQESLYRQGIVSVRDLVAPAAMEILPDHFRLNEKYARSFFVVTYPRFVTTGWFSPIINLNYELDAAVYVTPVSSERILKTLRNKVGQVQSTMAAKQEKGEVRDPMLETALNDVEELRNKLIQGTEKFFHLGVYVTIYCDTKEELEEQSKEIEGILGQKLIYTKRALFQQEQAFMTTLPLGDDRLDIQSAMNTAPLSTTFPFVSSELTSDEGVLYGINRHNNSLVIFDRFSLPNANSVIFATSGAGKSYAVKLEILRSLMFNTDVIVIDPENEYQHLAEAVGGTYVRLSLDSAYRINPFDLPKGVSDMKTGDVLRSAVITLKGLMRLMLGRITKEEDALLDAALIETYASKDITPYSDLNTVEPPTMSDFERVLSGMQGAEGLIPRIKKYTEGTFSGIFNQPTNVDLDNQLVVFSIRDLEEELRPIGMYVALTYIWNIVRSQLKKRLLVVDEAWIMMQNEDSARFMFSLAKRGRKYYVGLTTISQDVTDFLTSEFGKAIVTNSSMQLLLKQSPASIDLLQKTFFLTDEEKYLLLESQVGEGIFFAGSNHVAIKIVASYAEDQIVTTDPRQLIEIEEQKEEYDIASGAGEGPTDAPQFDAPEESIETT